MATSTFMEGRQERSTQAGTGNPEDDGPLRNIFKGLSPGRSLNFPVNMETVDHYVQFGAYAEQHFPAAGVPRANKSLLGSVRLPMPNQLPVAYAQTYKNTDLGPLGAAITGAFQENKGDFAGADINTAEGRDRIAEAATNTYEDALEKLGVSGAGAMLLQAATEGGTIAGAAGGGVAGAAIGTGLAKGVEGIAAAAGKAVNPHMAVIYERPQFRKFQFTYNLRPKNQEESVVLNKMIFFFKFYGAPSIEKGTHFINYPNQFKIHFKHNDFLFKLGDCVLDNVSVDYHGEGTPLYYDATATSQSGRKFKAPANIQLNLDFTETVIVTKDDIEKKGR